MKESLCAARRSTVRQELGYQRGGCFSSGYVEQLSLVQSNVEGIDVITDGLDDCIKMFSIFFDSIRFQGVRNIIFTR